LVSEAAIMEFAIRDDVVLAYKEAGTGDPPIVLLHGMAGDHKRLAPQFDHLQAHHRVVAPDLRGHGESAKPSGAYDVDVFVSDVLWMLGELGIEHPVLVGHSLGGSIGLAIAVAHPEAVRALVLLDSGIRSRETKAADLGSFYAGLGGPDHAERLRAFVYERLFMPTDDRELAEQLAETMARVPPDIFLAMARGVLSFDSFKAALACTVPSLLILSASPFTDRSTLEKLGPNWQVGQVVGSGHCLQLIVPDQVNAMLDRFLAMLQA
jgi:pimeloyl-ACP methyl ester carboxylesterase